MTIRDKIGKEIIVFDGAMGTMLQNSGLKLGELPEELNLEAPELITGIHRSYIEAGVDVITTNTFGANEKKLEKSNYNVEEIIASAVDNARRAVGNGNQYIALGLGSIGELLRPMGSLSFEEAYRIYRRQVEAGVEAGVDLILIETMTDLYELKAAVLAVKEVTDLALFTSMSFEEDGRTFTGCSPLSMIMVLEGLGVDALGVNCSLGPREIEPIVEMIIENSTIPVLVQPNAGLPEVMNGQTVYNFSKEEFAYYAKRFIKKGVSIIGGCCGTTNEYMKLLVDEIKGMGLARVERKKLIGVCSPTRPVLLDTVRVVGERINPTGKDDFKEDILSGQYDLVIREAILQNENGADILDINVGIPDLDEAETMVEVIEEIQGVVDIPLQLDSNDPRAIESGLRIYNGRPIINSVTGDMNSMDRIFPLAKKYGAMVVGLTLDRGGIPDSAEERYKIAERIVNRAEKFGLSKEDIIIDCLVLTLSTEQEKAVETLRAVRMVKEDLGVKTILGVSNISFGLPNRELLNRTFLVAGLNSGLDLAIVDPLDSGIMEGVLASKVLLNQDPGAIDYIEFYNSDGGLEEIEEKTTETYDLGQVIIQGNISLVDQAVNQMLEKYPVMKIIDEHIIPSLDLVGRKFEREEIFLPQLVQSAETVKKSFQILRTRFGNSMGPSRGKILLATVEGDVHDIGKNIVKVLLENYNYQVIDLGRDVPSSIIVKKILEEDISLVGLSALMTTTVKSMENTIKEIKSIDREIKVMVGGAVLTEDYAMRIGADFYARDAKESVNIANKHYNIK